MSIFRYNPAPATLGAEQEHVTLADAQKDERAKRHAEGHLLMQAVEGWVSALPWLKYTARNERVVLAAIRKRGARLCMVCLGAFAIARSRGDSGRRIVRDTSRRS